MQLKSLLVVVATTYFTFTSTALALPQRHDQISEPLSAREQKLHALISKTTWWQIIPLLAAGAIARLASNEHLGPVVVGDDQNAHRFWRPTEFYFFACPLIYELHSEAGMPKA